MAQDLDRNKMNLQYKFFYTTWCTACKDMEEILDNMNLRYPLEKIDIEENYFKAHFFMAGCVPCLMLVIDKSGVGQEFDYVKQIHGYRTAQELEDFLNLDENRIVDSSVVVHINTMMEHLKYKENMERLGK